MTEIEIDVNTNKNFNYLKGKTFDKVTIKETITKKQAQQLEVSGILSPDWVCTLKPMDKK